jgi:hypothetical protein
MHVAASAAPAAAAVCWLVHQLWNVLHVMLLQAQLPVVPAEVPARLLLLLLGVLQATLLLRCP